MMFLFQQPMTGTGIDPTTEWLYTSTTVFILAGATLAAFIAWAYYATKRENKPFGEVWNVMVVHQVESFLVVVTLMLFLAEAVLAATVHPPGEFPPPAIARFLSHFTISLAGMAANITLMKQFARIFEKDIDRVSLVARILLVFSLGMLAVGVPIMNGLFIAAGMGEDLKFYLFLQDFFNPFCSDSELADMVIKYGGNPSEYRTYGAMPYALKVNVGLMYVHIFIAIIAGLFNLASQDRRKLVFSNPYQKKEEGGGKEKKGDNKSDEEKREERRKRDEEYKGMPGEERHREMAEENLLYLLRRMRYEPGKQLDRLLDDATEALYAMRKHEHRIKMAARIASLRSECETFDSQKKSMSNADKDSGAEKLRKKIRKLFESSPSESRVENQGLGVTLKGGKK